MLDDDVDEEALLAAWAQADEDALEVLLEALPRLADTSVPLPQLQAAVARIRAGVADSTWPYDYFRPAANWGAAPIPHDDFECFMDALVSTMLPVGDVEDWEPEELAASPHWSTRIGWALWSASCARGQAPRWTPKRCSSTS